ncbi:MAG: EAL domain-containing protein [Thiogranum sp.]
MSTTSPRQINLLLACGPGIATGIRQHLDGIPGTPVCERIGSRAELLATLDRQAWDLLICELQLDDFNALDASTLIRSHDLNIPVILIAETGTEDIALRCLEAGVDQFITPNTHGFLRLPVLVQTLCERTANEHGLHLKKSELHASRDYYLDVFDNTSDLIQCLAADGSFLYTNRAWRETMGYTEDEVRSLTLLDVLHPDSRACCQDRFSRLQGGEELSQISFKFISKSGQIIHLTGDCGSLIKDGEAVSTRGIFKNVTETVQAEQALRASEARYQTLYEHAPDIYTTVGRDGTILSINHTGAGILGYRVEELINKPAATVIHPDDLPLVLEHMERQFNRQGPDHGIEYRKIRKDGSLLWVHQRASLDPGEQEPRLLVVCRDITDRRHLEDQLAYQATHDALTDLINRREFEKRLSRVLASQQAQAGEHALCYLDLDQFKFVNDSCGHIAGDELLRQVSGLLAGQIRSRDTLARLGGDEFAVLMEHCPIERAASLAEQIRISIENYQFQWAERRFSLGVSIGLLPLRGISSLKDALSLSDAACFTAKAKGRNQIHVHDRNNSVRDSLVNDVHWAPNLTTALEQDLFCLYAQPIHACTGSGGGNRYEILIRLRQNGRIVRPGAFMPAAERYNLSPRLDRWVFDHVLQWFDRHSEALLQTELCSLNLSALSLCDETFRDYVLSRLEKSGLPPQKLCFEVTETAAIANLSQATEFINALRQAGCHFALDDFGSGLSSYAYLRNLPVDMVKIDGIFVRNIATNEVDRMMVKSICEIVRMMGKETTAEYVESAEALGILRQIGVDYVQGYHLGRPAPLDEHASGAETRCRPEVSLSK